MDASTRAAGQEGGDMEGGRWVGEEGRRSSTGNVGGGGRGEASKGGERGNRTGPDGCDALSRKNEIYK